MSKKKIYAVIVEYITGITQVDSYWFKKENAYNRINKLSKDLNKRYKDIYYDSEYIADSEEVE